SEAPASAAAAYVERLSAEVHELRDARHAMLIDREEHVVARHRESRQRRGAYADAAVAAVLLTRVRIRCVKLDEPVPPVPVVSDRAESRERSRLDLRGISGDLQLEVPLVVELARGLLDVRSVALEQVRRPVDLGRGHSGADVPR